MVLYAPLKSTQRPIRSIVSSHVALFATIDAIANRAADWHGPFLMVVSPSDQIVDTTASMRFFQAARNASPSRLVEYSAGGHVLPLDTGNEAMAAQLAQFILTARKTEP